MNWNKTQKLVAVMPDGTEHNCVIYNLTNKQMKRFTALSKKPEGEIDIEDMYFLFDNIEGVTDFDDVPFSVFRACLDAATNFLRGQKSMSSKV